MADGNAPLLQQSSCNRQQPFETGFGATDDRPLAVIPSRCVQVADRSRFTSNLSHKRPYISSFKPGREPAAELPRQSARPGSFEGVFKVLAVNRIRFFRFGRSVFLLLCGLF